MVGEGARGGHQGGRLQPAGEPLPPAADPPDPRASRLLPSALTPTIVQNVLSGASAAVITPCRCGRTTPGSRSRHRRRNGAELSACRTRWRCSSTYSRSPAPRSPRVSGPCASVSLLARRHPVARAGGAGQGGPGAAVAAVGALMPRSRRTPCGAAHWLPGLRRRWDAFCARPSRPTAPTTSADGWAELGGCGFPS
ncbi:hypothetical protein QJS66_19955 [Kocuria rhizophila]|nr:hypothetical protein QJS66_19955 [Kocuria rhizophila]